MDELCVTFASAEALQQELGENLRGGGCFVTGAQGLAHNDACRVVLVHPESGERLELAARVVFVAADGVGVAFEGFSPQMRAELQRFVEAAPEPPSPTLPPAGGGSAEPNVHERMRNLSATEQLKLAREGDLQERIVLERLYGKVVWPTLLQNPRLTIGEVVRIARMHNLPQPQLEQIVGNAAWLHNGEIRRVLLGNPRLTGELMTRVLRALPRHELKIVPQQTCYPITVRQAAKKLLGVDR